MPQARNISILFSTDIINFELTPAIKRLKNDFIFVYSFESYTSITELFLPKKKQTRNGVFSNDWRFGF